MGLADSQEQYDERTRRLAANLAVDAALTLSFHLGDDLYIKDYRVWWMPLEEDWVPGCNRPAPGWTGKGEE